MKYQQPVGTAENAAYIDGNPGTGSEGSAVPARAIEHPQREIVNAITHAGLSPDANDLTQLRQAIALIAAAQTPTVEGFATGDIKQAFKAAPDAGWLLLNGDTIGNAGSGAIRSNAIYLDLFKHLWAALANAEAPVSGGRGASGQADWDAGKTLKIPDARGRSPIGAGTGAGLTLNLPLGGMYGEEKHAQTADEVGSHGHGVYYILDNNAASDNNPAGGIMLDVNAPKGTSGGVVQSSGGGTPFNVVHPVLGVNWFIKY